MSRYLFLALLPLLWTTIAWGAPNVVVSVKPVHSLVANIMLGAGSPTLLVKQGSPHGYALRPSEARALHRADLVIWVGPELESFLEKPLVAVESRQLQLTTVLLELLLPIREGGHWEKHVETHDHHHDHHLAATFDPHLWLGIVQAQQIAAATVAELSALDPTHAELYRANGKKLQQRLGQLEDDLTRQLSSVANTPYLVFHDAYQYFEKSFQLNAVGSVAIDPERRPGIRRLLEIRTQIKDLGARCVFSEPQFEPRLVATVIEGTGACTATLDPIGATIPPGPEAYFTLMHAMGDALAAALAASN